jgi:hypothetical protein
MANPRIDISCLPIDASSLNILTFPTPEPFTVIKISPLETNTLGCSVHFVIVVYLVPVYYDPKRPRVRSFKATFTPKEGHTYGREGQPSISEINIQHNQQSVLVWKSLQ